LCKLAVGAVVAIVNVTFVAPAPALICDGVNEQLLRLGSPAEQVYVTALRKLPPSGVNAKV
jgi:hypothetical protein